MLPHHLALISLSKKLTPRALSQTAAALQKQITRDLGPLWNITASIDYFPDLKSVPLGYWPIIIAENIKDPDAAGFHTDKHHQPYSLVEFDDTWQLTCSHEMCEMLVDPYGNKLAAAGSPRPSQGKVNFLVEVCDPCEDASFAYSINGILLSDFYTPNYFDPQPVRGVRYSFTGAITKPGEVLKNGYVSWQDPVTKKWYQATRFGSGPEPVIKLVNGMKSNHESLRAQMDRLTRNPNRKKAFLAAAKKHQPLKNRIIKSGQSKSEDWAEEIKKYLPAGKGAGLLGLTGDADNFSAVLTVSFNSGGGTLKATINRKDQTSDDFTFDSNGGTHTFDNVNPGDEIVANTTAASDVDFTIDRNTDVATPINIKGKTTRFFEITA